MLKDDLNNREFTGKVLTSAGMGKQYFERGDWKFNKYNGENTREYYVFKNGTRAMMPRYYRDKIYSEEEKELLWLQKLDKVDTWVMGERCKIDEFLCLFLPSVVVVSSMTTSPIEWQHEYQWYKRI